MSVNSEAYDGSSAFMITSRGQLESMKHFEIRFSAAVVKLNSFSATKKQPQLLTKLMLLNNDSIEYSERVSVLSAAAPTGTFFPD